MVKAIHRPEMPNFGTCWRRVRVRAKRGGLLRGLNRMGCAGDRPVKSNAHGRAGAPGGP